MARILSNSTIWLHPFVPRVPKYSANGFLTIEAAPMLEGAPYLSRELEFGAQR
jgi:hypothetical protein